MDTERTKANSLGYFPAFDGLRGVAVLAVITLHASIPFHLINGVSILGVGGFLGVDIFFVLSGFLITSLLVKEWETTGDISFGKFYTRRALRLLPALYALIIVAVIYSLIFVPTADRYGAARDVLVLSFYLANWLPVNLYALEHTWSLAVEEQFYLVYPIFLLVVLSVAARLKIKRQWIIALLLIMIAIVAIYRGLMYAQFGFSRRLYMGSDMRADSLLVGCVAALLYGWNFIPRSAAALRALKAAAVLGSAGIIYIMLTAEWDDAKLYYGGFTVIAALAGLVIISLRVSPPRILKIFLEQPILIWVGQISYGVYLWHRLVYMIADSILPSISIPSYTIRYIVLPPTVKIAGSIMVAAVSFYCLEKPFLRLKKRFPPANKQKFDHRIDIKSQPQIFTQVANPTEGVSNPENAAEAV